MLSTQTISNKLMKRVMPQRKTNWVSKDSILVVFKDEMLEKFLEDSDDIKVIKDREDEDTVGYEVIAKKLGL